MLPERINLNQGLIYAGTAHILTEATTGECRKVTPVFLGYISIMKLAGKSRAFSFPVSAPTVVDLWIGYIFTSCLL